MWHVMFSLAPNLQAKYQAFTTCYDVRMIGEGHKSREIYQLTPPVACVSFSSLALAHQCLGNPSLEILHFFSS